MSCPTIGLHPVTATVDEAQAALDFCVEALGLRLVKKTVNFDNHHVFHFYYGTERGAPGTIWTTFPYRDNGVPMGRKGDGQVVATSFSVPGSSLAFWQRRLKARGVEAREIQGRFGEDALAFQDPSGLHFELVASDRDSRKPWSAGGIDAADAIRGLHSVTMTVRSLGEAKELMTELLGYQIADQAAGRTRFVAGGDQPGHAI